MEKFHFTTIVSKDYLFKFLILYESLNLHCHSYKLYVLCAHDGVYQILKEIGFENVVVHKLADVEDEELLNAKSNRSFHEYCWTLKPVFFYYILTQYKDAEYFAHLDADLCFFQSPELIFGEDKNASLFLTHHRNSEMFIKFYDHTGIYNTGFVGCKNNETAYSAIGEWKRNCLLSCPIKEDVEKRIFGDQRYVEDWPEQYEGVHVVKSAGANAALWNIVNYKISLKRKKVYLNDDPLIFYHFSGLVVISPDEFNLCWYYHIDDQAIVSYIYMPYLRLLRDAIQNVKTFFPQFESGFLKKEYTPDTHYFKLSQ